MTPDEKKLYALMAVAEQQQTLVNQAVKEASNHRRTHSEGHRRANP